MEWLRQADDDLKSAEVLLKGARYIHSVFFCHLAVEKSLKAIYARKFKKEPPRTHNLTFLLSLIEIEPPMYMQLLVDRLATASVPTRYPEDLRQMSVKYTKSAAADILEKSKEVSLWTRKHLKE